MKKFNNLLGILLGIFGIIILCITSNPNPIYAVLCLVLLVALMILSQTPFKSTLLIEIPKVLKFHFTKGQDDSEKPKPQKNQNKD